MKSGGREGGAEARPPCAYTKSRALAASMCDVPADTIAFSSAQPAKPLTLLAPSEQKAQTFSFFFLSIRELKNLHLSRRAGSRSSRNSSHSSGKELQSLRQRGGNAQRHRRRLCQATSRMNHARPQISAGRASEAEPQAPGDAAAAAPQIRAAPPEGRAGRGAR
jgi:hypothetical protein